jgi:hypothetical protein
MKPQNPTHQAPRTRQKEVLVIQLTNSRAMIVAGTFLFLLTTVFFLGILAGSGSGEDTKQDQYQSPPPGYTPASPTERIPNQSYGDNHSRRHSVTIPLDEKPNQQPSNPAAVPPIPPQPQFEEDDTSARTVSSTPQRTTNPVDVYMAEHPIPRTGPYVIRIATHNNETTAQDTSDYLTYRGFPTQVKSVIFSSGKTVYQIESDATYNSAREAVKAVLDLIDRVNVPGIEEARIVKKQ